jgi:hypothetical protein
MDEIQKSQDKAVEFLKTIQSLDDLKAHKKEVLDLMEQVFKAALETLKAFFEATLSPEDRQKQMARFQDEHFLFSEEMENELERIDALPGAAEYFETFKEEMDKRMGPYAEEMAEQMMKLMTNFMGDLMGGLAEGLGEAFGGMGEEEEEPPSVEYHWDEFQEAKCFLEYRNVEAFKNGKNEIIEDMEWRLDSFLDDINNLKFISEDMEIDKEEVDESVKRQELINNELELGFKNLAGLPGGEEIKQIQEEIMNKLKPKFDEINNVIEVLKKAKLIER